MTAEGIAVAVRRGIDLLDLLPQTSSAALSVPDGIIEKIGVLTVLDHRSTTSGDFFLHEGTLQSIADALDLDTSAWVLRIPGLTHGLPFRLAIRRAAPAAGAQEAVPTLWTLDIEVWDVEALIPGVRAAKPVGGTGVTPLTLQPIGTSDATRRVFLVASGVVRVSGGGPGGTTVQVVDAPDPFDPTAPTGAVVRLTARPSSFLFGSSQYGMTLDTFVLDLSHTFTPPEIVARGHDETWEGVGFKETTFYFPPDTPLVHSLSVSARDVIIGEPGGLQGELRIEFGEDFNDLFNTRMAIQQLADDGSQTPVAETTPTPPPRGPALQFAITTAAGNAARRIRAVFDIGPTAMVPGHTDLAAVGVWWRLPDGSEGTTATTPWFDAPTSNLLRYRLRLGDPSTATNTSTPASAVPEGQTELVEVTAAFPRTAASPTGSGPVVDAVVGAASFSNVLHLRGPRALLATVTLNVRGGTNADWQLGSGSAPVTARQVATFAIPLLPDGTTSADLVVSTANGRRRVRVEVVPQGPLGIGHQTSATPSSPSAVTVVGSGDATPTDVTDTFLATPFHTSGDRPAASDPATISGTTVVVPQGADAEIEVPVPAGGNDPLPTPPPPATTVHPVVQVLFPFGESTAVEPGGVKYPYDGGPTSDAVKHDPDAYPLALSLAGRGGPDGATVPAQLTSWITTLGTPNGRRYYVVGRTDDLKYAATKTENDTYNDTLATNRANAARDALVTAGVPAADIIVRNETTDFTTGTPVPGSPPTRITALRRMALPWPQAPAFGATAAPVFNRLWNADGTTGTLHSDAIGDDHRFGYRSAEIYAVDTGAPATPPPPPPAGQGVPTRFLVPGPDGAPSPGVVATTAATPPTDYRVRLRVKWDSPTVVNLGDAVPTEAEALVAWKSAQVELPATASGSANTIPRPTGPDYWEVLLHWTYDARTGQTEASGALSLPDGRLMIQSDALAGALAFGPAITALANPADVTTDPVGQFVGAAAIMAVGAVIGELLNAGSGPESSVDIDKVGISYTWNGTPHVAATVDYTIDLRINVSIAGAGSLVGRLRMKYKNVGVRFDGASGGGLAGVALTYDSLSVEVVDPGTWSLGGPLGNLIRIATSRMGNGSQWMEFDLEFALDLGVITLEGATIRLVLAPFSVEFRGLTASITIPETIKGRGAVTIGDGGSFRALLAVEVIPAKLSAYGALAVDQDFVAIEVGVQLPVGIPLANTGLAIFGFMGRFVANGTRNLEGLTNPDPVQKQLDWYVRSPEQKYRRRSGQFAFGVGAVIGTLPDGGFTFNAEGTLSIGFPDVSVIFGIDAHLISQRKSQATESGTTSSSTFRILGMVLIEPESIMVAVRGSYEIPKVLKLQIPISAFFPLAGGAPWYIRVGTDNDATRPGSPVSITLLPDTLDVRAWAFVMVEERQLHHLGGTLVPLDLADPLDFDGFSIGMGAGFDLKYSAGPFSVEITAFLLVGLGTKPLLFAGVAGIKGELDLVVVSVGVDGFVHFHVSPGYDYIEGHFCGHVDCFFFTISGCVDIRIGDDPPTDIPEPGSPLVGIDLVDHLSGVKGRASRTGSGDAVPTVWPDTVGVLKFAHFVDDALGTGADFDRKLIEPAALSPWSGSTELKYAFRLTGLGLWKLTGGDPAVDSDWTQIHGPFDSAWWMPTWRTAVVSGGGGPGPSTEEGRELGVFSWDPRAWSRWLGEGSQDLPGHPANTVHEVCDPAAPADPTCAYGRDGRFANGALAAFPATPTAGAVFASRFTVLARLADGLDAGTLAALGADAGWQWQPGGVAPLHGGVTILGQALVDGWRFPAWHAAGRFVATAPIDLAFSKPLLEGEVVLEVCGTRAVGPKGEAVCDTMPERDGLIEAFAGQSGSKYQGPSLQAFADGGERALRLLKGLLEGFHPGPTDAVAVDLSPVKGEAVVTALAADGSVLGQAVSAGPDRQTLRVEADGITHVVVKGDEIPIVYQVCWGRQPAVLDLVDIETLVRPRVVATNADGKSVVVDGEEVDIVLAPPTLDPQRKRCPKLRYKLPRGAGWTHVEIAPWAGGTVSLVAVCGVTLEAAIAQQADGDYRQSFQDLVGLWVAAATDNKPTHQVYLDPSSTYELWVDWQYQGWRPATPGADPPPPASTDWHSPAHGDRYRFTTAAFGLAGAPAPVHDTSLDADPAQGGPGYDERTFDPRGITRYLTRAFPDHDDAPHFLDDHAGFWFMVDHLEALVEKYDRILQAKVLHTRPAAGSVDPNAVHVPGTTHDLDVTISATWHVDTLTWFPADLALVEAVEASPCLTGTPAVGSSSVSVTADLEPRSEYDLLLNAAPRTVGAFDEVPIARTHFRTSAYRNPTELLRALGFAAPLGIVPPTDAVATVPLPPGALEIGDAQLDAALTTLGLDPWPLAVAPRTTVIWCPPAGTGQPWRVAAVLVEADEPVWRAGFATGAEGEAAPPPRLEVATLQIFRTSEHSVGFGGFGIFHHPLTVTRRDLLGGLTERVRNAAGTRSIFAAASPIPMTGGRIYDLAVALRENGAAGAAGSVPMVDRPLFVLQEGE